MPETGISVLGMSHRSRWFRDVVDEAESNLRMLLEIPKTYRVLFLQGGGSLQFSMVPMNFLRGTGKSADYIVSGYWSAKAVPEARCEGNVHVVWDGRDDGYRRFHAKNVGVEDILRTNSNVVMLWRLHPSDTDASRLTDCLK